MNAIENQGEQIGDWLDQLETQVSSVVPLSRKQELDELKMESESKAQYMISSLRSKLGYERVEAVVINKPSYSTDSPPPIESVGTNNSTTGADHDERESSVNVGGNIHPWRLSSMISSDLVQIGNLGIVADRWTSLSSATKLTILFSLVGLGERKLSLVRDDVRRISELASSDPVYWVQLTGQMIGNVGLDGKMLGLTNMPTENEIKDIHKQKLSEAIDRLVNIAKQSPFRFIPREWCYLGTKAKKILAPKMTIGSYKGLTVENLNHSTANVNVLYPVDTQNNNSDSNQGGLGIDTPESNHSHDSQTDNWGLKINIKPESAINHTNRLELLKKASDAAMGSRMFGRMGAVRPGGYRNLPTGMKIKSPINQTSGFPPQISTRPEGIQSNQANKPYSPESNQLSPSLGGSGAITSTLTSASRSGPFSGNSVSNVTTGMNPNVGVGVSHASPVTGFGAASAMLHARPRPGQVRPTMQPKNKLGLMTNKKKPPLSSNPVLPSIGGGSGATQSWRRTSTEDVLSPGGSNNVNLQGGDTQPTGLNRPSKIRFVPINDTAVLMNEREAAIKEQRDKVVEEREARKIKRKQAAERRKSADRNQGSGSEVEDEKNYSSNDESDEPLEAKLKSKIKEQGMNELEDGWGEEATKAGIKRKGSPISNRQSVSGSPSHVPHISTSLSASSSSSAEKQREARSTTKRARRNENPLEDLINEMKSEPDSETGQDNTGINDQAEVQPEQNAQENYVEPDPETINAIFGNANVVTDSEKQTILNFLSGREINVEGINAENPVLDIVLRRNEVENTKSSKSNRVVVEQVLFQMNIVSGEWKMLKRRVKQKP
ncbi:hypothetical protein BB558_001724 [Smittium angustum]|uniref:Uncharacterized protein n=1 Tax=Smittium angustum TaxID=133377 RepID=A0A2U1J0F6_SMIAN|nr:hypothetical protein BB558_005440 [Smittium angustum]PWA02133.1 hypothetical protein BB558_001724 [Smittium angustum]